MPIRMLDLFTWPAVCLSAILLLSGCDSDEEIAQDDTGPVVGVMELPISLRSQDAAPDGAARIEASPSELRLDGRKILDLERGRVPESSRGGNAIIALLGALDQGRGRRAATLRLHVNTPYETTWYILQTLKEANMHDVAFEVRPPGGGVSTGWLVLRQFILEEPSDEPYGFEPGLQRQWDELVQGWEEAYEACRRDHYVDCAAKPITPAEGGKLQIRFFARGSALKVELTRFGVEEPEEAPQPEMLDGIEPPPEGEEELPPVTSGAFTWRFQAATDELSPISGAFRPLCGARECGIEVTGDPETMTMRLISFLGAAFPNGTQSPRAVFRRPAQP